VTYLIQYELELARQQTSQHIAAQRRLAAQLEQGVAVRHSSPRLLHFLRGGLRSMRGLLAAGRVPEQQSIRSV
jgi:hypothetical protein